MGYIYVMVRLKDPSVTASSDFQWTRNVADWAVSSEEIKEKLIRIYPSSIDQWEERHTVRGDGSKGYLWGQVPQGPRFEFTVHFRPFPWLSIDTTDTEEVIKLAKLLNLSVLDVQAGIWTYLQAA